MCHASLLKAHAAYINQLLNITSGEFDYQSLMSFENVPHEIFPKICKLFIIMTHKSKKFCNLAFSVRFLVLISPFG